jgi:hypothetical protein
MAAKKMPAKKTPAKKMASQKAPAKKTAGKVNKNYSDEEAIAEVKKAFLSQAKAMGAGEIVRYGGDLGPKRKGTVQQWARNVDNAMGDTWFEGQAAADIGIPRAGKILKKYRDTWIKPMYDGSSGPTVKKKPAPRPNPRMK